MVQSVSSAPITPIRPKNAESSGILASRSQNIFAAAPSIAAPNIFGAETSGAVACGSFGGSSGGDSGGGCTVAVA